MIILVITILTKQTKGSSSNSKFDKKKAKRSKLYQIKSNPNEIMIELTKPSWKSIRSRRYINGSSKINLFAERTYQSG